jgi:hypothetical protein
MPYTAETRKRRPSRVRVLAATALLTAVLLGGCGGGSSSQTTTSAEGSRTPTGADVPLEFARCMRANGVPNFPDPQPGGAERFVVPTGTAAGAPAFRAAQTKCQRFLGSGLVGPGAATHPSAQTLAKLLRIARCMRQRGVPQFPDPATSVPASPSAAGIREITDFDGAILLFPATIDMQAPAYRQALHACGAPPLGLPH